MAIQLYSKSVSQATMQKAERLAEMIPTLPRNREKRTGIEYVVVPSSDDPEHTGHATNGLSCTCLGFDRYSICSHSLAYNLVLQRQTAARIEAAQQKRRENGQCKQQGCILTAETKMGRCESHTRALLSLVADL